MSNPNLLKGAIDLLNGASFTASLRRAVAESAAYQNRVQSYRLLLDDLRAAEEYARGVQGILPYGDSREILRIAYHLLCLGLTPGDALDVLRRRYHIAGTTSSQ